MKNILRWITAGLTATFVALSAYAADMAPGTFSAGTVKGDVTYKLAGTSTFLKLEAGTTLPQGSTVKTGAESLAIVVFASGSTATVRPSSEVVINFDQQAFTGPIPAGSEPSVSKTQVRIVNGTVISSVAKLKKGSEFNVTTPVGAAGVRGTVFSVTYNATTKQFTVLVAEGAVVFTRNADGTVTAVNKGQILDSEKNEVGTASATAVAALEQALADVAVDTATPDGAGEAGTAAQVANNRETTTTVTAETGKPDTSVTPN